MKYSTIMPVYNAGYKLRKSIESVISQTYSNWELIIVNDGSSDNSLEICNEYAMKDSRIIIINQKNHGPGYARNVGIKKANGDYITFLDADDYYSSDFYSSLLKNNSDMIFYGIVKENENGINKEYISTYKYRKYKKEDLIKLQLMGILSWGAWRKIIKASIAKECLFIDLPVGEEVLFSFNAMKKSNKIDFVDKYLYYHVFNDEGQHSKGGIDPWKNVAIEVKKEIIEKTKQIEYESTINGLAFRGLCIAIKRICCCNNFKEAKSRIKEYVSEYKKKFNIYFVDKKLLDRLSKIIMILLKLKLYSIIYIGTRIKYKCRKEVK